uniref:Uncharacterized protein n=1 Tax=Lactuca sativa TaxID=4236 RepID=A0A9R1WHH0_LACSA|nr:hypothetical protein LSAT_V11C200083380 [Lactuca sativa]
MRTQVDLNQHGDKLEVIDNKFESAGYKENSRKRMLRKLNKKVPCSSGVVHDIPLYMGQSFKTKKDVQGVVIDSSGGPSIVSKVTSKDKTIINKKDLCPFAIQISSSTEKEPWLVKTIIDENLCLQIRNVKACTSKFLATNILQKENSNLRIPVSSLHEELHMDLGLSLSKMKVFMSILQRIGYMVTLKGNTLQTNNPDVGTDPNIGIYPIAYYAVEAWSTRSWTWFLECLGDDLDLDASCNFTFVSNKQKLQWRVEKAIDHLWRRFTSTTLGHFEMEIEDLKVFNDKAYEWLCKIHNTFNCLLNNLCEVFNSKLDHGKDKPIVNYLEYIRVYLMKRHFIVKKEIDKCIGQLDELEGSNSSCRVLMIAHLLGSTRRVGRLQLDELKAEQENPNFQGTISIVWDFGFVWRCLNALRLGKLDELPYQLDDLVRVFLPFGQGQSRRWATRATA